MNLLNSGFGLIIVPIMVTKLSIHNFGILSVNLSILSFFVVCIEFGFNTTAVREIAKNSRLNIKNNRYFYKVFIIKTIISLLLIPSYSIYNIFYGNSIYVWFSLYLIGNLLSPYFYFMGVQKMFMVTIFSFVNRLLLFIFLISIVANTDDALSLVVKYYSYSYFVSGLIAFIYANYLLSTELGKQLNYNVKNIFFESAIVFAATLSSSVYRYSLIPIISIYLNPSVVGVVSFLDKIFKGIQSILNSVAVGIFPVICSGVNIPKIFNGSFVAGLILIIYIFIGVVVGVFHELLGLSLSNQIISNDVFNMLIVGAIISFWCGSYSFYLGTTSLLSAGRSREFTKSVLIGAIVFFIFSLILGVVFKNTTVMISLPLSEAVVLLMIFTSIYKSVRT